MFHRSWLISLALLSASIQAADHIDAPTARNDPAADLNDTYAFVNPNNADEVILIATINPFATRASLFSDAVVYRFFFTNESGAESEIACSFSLDQTVTCTGPDGREVSGPTGQVNTNGDFRVFAGLREDPFFFDFEAFQQTIETGTPAFTDPGTDFFAGLNVLGLVVGIDIDAVSPEPDAKVHFNHQIWASTERVAGAGINSGVTGSWYQADNPGQGWIIEVVSTPAADAKSTAVEQFVVYHFAYQDGEQLWFAGNGEDIDGDTATIEVFRTGGAQFGDDFLADDVTLESVGTMTFTFNDCRTGNVSFVSTAADLEDYSLDIERLTDVTGLSCTFFKSGQIDREGRPAVNSALIAPGRKDPYNFADDPATWADMFTEDLVSGLTFTDSLDGIDGNLLTGDEATLASVLVDDRLVTYLNIPECGSYLAVEAAALGGVEPTECGGRTLEADVVDVTLSAVVSGFEIAVGDGVDANDVEFLDDFPFLAPPHD